MTYSKNFIFLDQKGIASSRHVVTLTVTIHGTVSQTIIRQRKPAYRLLRLRSTLFNKILTLLFLISKKPYGFQLFP